MKVPNQLRRILDKVFSPSQESFEEKAFLRPSNDERISVLGGVILFILGLLALPAIPFLLLLLMN